MDWILDHWRPGRVVYYEHHAGNAPSYMQIRHQVQTWRIKAQKELQVPFFAFSLVREPLSLAVSYFNYYHTNTDKKNRFEYLPHPTEYDFIRTALSSPQCLFLTRTEIAYRTNSQHLRDNLTLTECESAYTALIHDMDWIGTTERMVHDTFPLLRHVTNLSLNFPQRNQSRKRIAISDLSASTVQYIGNITAWDRKLYEQIQHDFQIDMFLNYNPTIIR